MINNDCDINQFYDNIRDLKKLLKELRDFNKFRYLIDEIIKRYKDNGKNKDLFKKLLKLENERNSLEKNIMPHKTLFGIKYNT